MLELVHRPLRPRDADDSGRQMLFLTAGGRRHAVNVGCSPDDQGRGCGRDQAPPSYSKEGERA